jgi:hypothetical protein
MEEGVEPVQEKNGPSEGARQAQPERRRTSVPEGESRGLRGSLLLSRAHRCAESNVECKTR